MDISEKKKFYQRKKESIEFWITCNCLNVGGDCLDDNYNEYFYKICDSITELLDYIAIHLVIGKYDPTDITCEFESKEEYKEYHVNQIKEKFSSVIEYLKLEVIYYLAYKYCKYIFMEEEIFGDDYNAEEKIPGKEIMGSFTPEIENYLVNELNVRKLYG